MPLFQRGAIEALGEDPEIEVVAQAATGEAALEAIIRTAPDVALLEVELPGLDGEELLRGVARADLATRVLLLTLAGDPAAIRRGLASGVSGCLSKRASEAELRSAVIVVAGGGTVLTEELRVSVLDEIAYQADRQMKQLSKRERETLQLMADGHSSKEIGGILHLSERTVKTYRSRLYGKLDVGTETAAVAAGIRLDLIH